MIKTYFRNIISILIISQIFLITLSGQSHGITDVKQIEDVGIDEKLGEPVPTDITYLNEEGEEVVLEQYFDGKRPVVLNLVYFSCPRVCNYGTNGLLDVVNELDSLDLGDDYQAVTLSFNPDEKPELAKEKAVKYRKGLKNSTTDQSWPFLTGSRENIRKLTDSLGFNFKKDGEEYAHPTALIVLTPDAKISRYLYGIDQNTKDMKLSLLEAADGEIGSSETLNKVLLYCYQFDPVGKKYALQALNVVKLGGVVTLLVLGTFLTVLWKREK